MSFKFDFQLEDEELDDQVIPQPSARQASVPQAAAEAGPSTSRACHHVELGELLDSLPETISYTPFSHPSLTTPLLRRDLFDARFQLISQDAKGKDRASDEDEDYVDAKSDLIPGLYEGGLKTWEGGVDLVEVLSEGAQGKGKLMRGKQVLEVGCGTALPSSFLLDRLLAAPASSSSGRTTLHLQDYNLLVLQLVTLPNLLLAALPYLPPDSLRSADDAVDVESVLPDLNEPGHLSITATVKDAFLHLLDQCALDLKFTYGHWAGLAESLKGEYDLILTAETIYAEESVDDLVSVLRAGEKCIATSSNRTNAHETVGVELEDTFGNMSVKEDWVHDLSEGQGVILVAAKILYFGVGGGLAAFLDKVGWWTGIKEWTRGVGRKVVRVGWHASTRSTSR